MNYIKSGIQRSPHTHTHPLVEDTYTNGGDRVNIKSLVVRKVRAASYVCVRVRAGLRV